MEGVDKFVMNNPVLNRTTGSSHVQMSCEFQFHCYDKTVKKSNLKEVGFIRL